LNADGFRGHGRRHCDRDVTHRGYGYCDTRLRWRKTAGSHGNSVVAGKKIVEAKFAAVFGGGVALRERSERLHHDVGGSDARAGCILNRAPERSSRVLPKRHEWRKNQARQNGETHERIGLTRPQTENLYTHTFIHHLSNGAVRRRDVQTNPLV
jgi:hypothetical protein